MICRDCMLEQIAQLERLVYVPGLWRCAKCGCSIISSNLSAATGQVSANNTPQTCPNECGPMWRVTERDAGNRLIDQQDAQRPTIEAAYHALRSYQHGNAATGLAADCADNLRDAFGLRDI